MHACDLSYEKPSKIQSQAILILNPKEKRCVLIAQAPSGCGKTAAFICSMILHIDPVIKKVQTVWIANTREAVIQDKETFDELNEYTKLVGTSFQRERAENVESFHRHHGVT